MNAFDLDSLRDRWAESGRRVDTRLDLDMDAVRALLITRTRRAFSRHSRWLAVTAASAFVISIGLLAFIATHWGQWLYVLMAALILPLTAAFAVVDLVQLRALSRLGFDRPTAELREQLDALQARQVALVKWEILLAVLLWFPVLIVPLKGIFGIDILRSLPASVVWVNLLLGVAIVPLGLLVSSWTMRRWGSTPAMRRLLIDMAGGSWARARAAYDVMEAGAATRIPADVAVRVRSLRRRLLATAWLFGLSLGAIGVFNAMQGERPHLIVAGVVLIFAIVPQLVGTGMHRRALVNFGDDESQLRQRAEAIMQLRRASARAVLVALPALILPLTMVLARLVAGIDLLPVLSLAGLAVWAVAGVGASVATALWLRGAPGRGDRAADLVTLGALSRTRNLLSPPP